MDWKYRKYRERGGLSLCTDIRVERGRRGDGRRAEKRGNVAQEVRVVTRKGMSKEKGEAELERLRADEARDLKISKVIRCRVRYFTEGAVIGSQAFVNEVFSASRERFGPKRRDGARKPRGALLDLAGEIWSLWDLQRRY